MVKVIEFIINGTKKKVEVKSKDLLLNVIRNELQLTGTKYGCGIGVCGACTVLVDGEPMLSCLMLAVDVDGKDLVTIEGIVKEDQLDVIQKAFLEKGAVQCGFCTPGFIMTAKSLLAENTDPTEKEIREYIKGNLCRCTGYVNIVKVIKRAANKKVGDN